MNGNALLSAGGAAQYIEDVFSAYTYTGSATTITNGIDLATKGGLVWNKERGAGSAPANSHCLADTVSGTSKLLHTDTTDAQLVAGFITAFNSNGYALGSSYADESGVAAVSWSFAQANYFFKIAQVVVSGSNQTVDLSSLGTVGMVTVKRTDAASNWYVWHISQTAGDLTYLNLTNAQTADASISMSGTTLTLNQATIGNGTFIVYAWAHDTSATELIQCGSFTPAGAGLFPVTLGWEPQLILIKRATTAGGPWILVDNSRDLGASYTESYLAPNTSAAEAALNSFNINATGFIFEAGSADTFIYMAIRRGPMKLPTVGTQVYNAIARTGTSAISNVTGVGFPPDLVTDFGRSGQNLFMIDRLRGKDALVYTNSTAAELSEGADGLTSFNMDGISYGADANGRLNFSGTNYIQYFFRRYPGVFDEVCFTTTSGGSYSGPHNLTVVPEFMIVKSRGYADQWYCYHAALGSSLFLELNTTNTPIASANCWGTSGPTATTFTTGAILVATQTIVAYLFATLAGISKVGSYTGNGGSLNLNMGFSGNARFFLCKRTDAVGDWFVWDSTRGINGGGATDPHLSLNTIAAEVTTDSSVEPFTTGLTVVQNAATNINVNAATYIFLALS